MQLVTVIASALLIGISSAEASGNGTSGAHINVKTSGLSNSVLHEMEAAWDVAMATARGGVTATEPGEKLLQEMAVAFASEGGNGDALHEAAETELPELEAALSPILLTLPSDQHMFNSVAVRYALHRLFVRRHGWFMVGLDPEGQSWEKSSPSNVAVLQKMPKAVRTVIETRLHGPGLVGREVAVLAALFEYLVHQESSQRLRKMYQVLGWSTRTGSASNTAEMARKAIDIYMANYVVGQDPTTSNSKKLIVQYEGIEEAYPTWRKTHEFIQGILNNEQAEAKPEDQGFACAARALAKIGEQFGVFQNSECQQLKSTLIGVEDRGTGYVRLGDFYGMALHDGKWQFSESIPYLRQLGALDESNRNNMRVIIANYINGHSNCIASSKYYSVCCISECETIMSHLEHQLQVSEASPEDVAALIASFPSRTVPANRTLSTLMVRRLNAIAANHGGKVPLYSRLFAQWLHHAYPRECSYPHLSGTTNPQQVEGWMKSGLNPTASPEDMRRIAGANASYRHFRRGPVEEPPWSLEEELFVPKQFSMDDPPTAWLTVNAVVIVAAVSITTFGFSLLRSVRAGRKAMQMNALQANRPKLYPNVLV